MQRLGWHLDDVPQPFLAVRRAAFTLLVLLGLSVFGDGLLLGYDGTHNRSVVGPLLFATSVLVIAIGAGAVFAWTNKKSPRWLAWRKTMPSLTPGRPPEPHS